MAAYLITYDLRTQGNRYGELFKRIKAYDEWAHISRSVWAVKTDRTAQGVYDQLLATLDDNDTLFIVRVDGASWNSWNLDDDVADWLKRNVAS